MEQIQVIIPENCGNSPKSKFLIDVHVAMAQGDINALDVHLDSDFSGSLNGRSIGALTPVLEFFQQNNIHTVIIHRVITHGKEGVVTGIIKSTNQEISFCTVVEFVSAGNKVISMMDLFWAVRKRSNE